MLLTLKWQGEILIGNISFRRRVEPKLDAHDAELIRQLREDHKLKLREIAEKFDVAVSTVCDICKYRRW